MQCKDYRGQHTTDARIAATQLSDPHPNLGKNTWKRHASLIALDSLPRTLDTIINLTTSNLSWM